MSALIDQQLVHKIRQPSPALGLFAERPQVGFGDGVVLRVAVVLGLLPGAFDQPGCSRRTSAGYNVP
jgi:hypothetical protein